MGCSASELTARNNGGLTDLDIGDNLYAPASSRGDGSAYFTWKKENEIVQVSKPDS